MQIFVFCVKIIIAFPPKFYPCSFFKLPPAFPFTSHVLCLTCLHPAPLLAIPPARPHLFVFPLPVCRRKVQGTNGEEQTTKKSEGLLWRRTGEDKGGNIFAPLFFVTCSLSCSCILFCMQLHAFNLAAVLPV